MTPLLYQGEYLGGSALIKDWMTSVPAGRLEIHAAAMPYQRGVTDVQWL